MNSPPQKNKHLVVTQLADRFQSVSTNESDEQKIAAIIQLLNNKTKQDMYVRYRWLQLGNCQHVSYHYAKVSYTSLFSAPTVLTEICCVNACYGINLILTRLTLTALVILHYAYYTYIKDHLDD